MPFAFRPGTIDDTITAAIWAHGEYPLPMHFRAGDVVIDCGAHIGAFTALCLDRGAGQVLAVEAHPENYAILRAHFDGDDRVLPIHRAVWRSDEQGATLSLSPYGDEAGKVNTGCADVFAQDGPRVPAVALDTLIGERAIRLLKLDCEGSEFPALATSRKLAQVAEIVGEVHEYGGPEDTLAPPLALPNGMPWTAIALGALLTAQGFRVRLARKMDRFGRPTRLVALHAVRRDWPWPGPVVWGASRPAWRAPWTGARSGARATSWSSRASSRPRTRVT